MRKVELEAVTVKQHDHMPALLPAGKFNICNNEMMTTSIVDLTEFQV